MISVQNRLLQSNGSKYLILLLVVLFSGCGIFTSTKKPSPNTNIKQNKEKQDVIKIPSKVDTIAWTEIEGERDPIGKVKKPKEVIVKENEKKNVYKIAAFIPFESNQVFNNVQNVNDLHNYNFIQYYGGMKLAMEQLEVEGINVELNVFDSKGDSSSVRQILNYEIPQDVDVILGSFNKESLELLAKFGKNQQVPVVSPWLTSRSITAENDFYVQFRPYLIEHYYKIVEHALNTFDKDDIILVSRNDPKEVRRFSLFQDKAEEILEEKNPLGTFTFNENELLNEDPLFRSKFAGKDSVAIIIPNFSKKDEQYVYNVLRRLNLERGNTKVIVYGMPMIIDMSNMSFDFLVNMKIRACVSRFLDPKAEKREYIFREYFNEYQDFATLDAYEGFDNMLYVGRALEENGTLFYKKALKDQSDYVTTQYDMIPIYNKKQDDIQVQYYENKYLMIVEFKKDKYIKVYP